MKEKLELSITELTELIICASYTPQELVEVSKTINNLMDAYCMLVATEKQK